MTDQAEIYRDQAMSLNTELDHANTVDFDCETDVSSLQRQIFDRVVG